MKTKLKVILVTEGKKHRNCAMKLFFYLRVASVENSCIFADLKN